MEKQELALSVRHFANLFQNLQQVADTLDTIGSLENAAAEAKRDRAAAEADRDKAKAALKKLEAQIAAKTEECNASIEEANGRRNTILADAIEQGRIKLEAAQADADAAVAKAKAQASDLIAAAKAEKADLEAANKSLTDGLQALGESVAAKQAEADARDERIAKAQAKIAKMLGQD